MVVWWEAGLRAEDLGGNGLDAGEFSGGQACNWELWVDRPNNNGNSLEGVSTIQMMGWMYRAYLCRGRLEDTSHSRHGHIDAV
jgi:hypothetical protein